VGITCRPWSRCQRSIICAGEFPCRSAIRRITGSSRVLRRSSRAGRLTAVVGQPDNRLEEQLVTVAAGAAPALAHLALVEVRGGGVDMTVAGAQCRLDGAGGLLGRRLEDAEAEGGQGDVVVQRQSWDVVTHEGSPVGRIQSRVRSSWSMRG